ncbi:MAG: HAD-IIIC family phosphatase [Bacteroidetes bacterium]|nr:MAG: HAD-IIIC family phosphatase [Bacteroidota bacterium]
MVAPFLSAAALRSQAQEAAVGKTLPGPPQRVALLGARNTRLLAGFLPQAARLAGLPIELFDAPFDQIEAQILNPQSETYRFQPDIIVLLPSLDKLRAHFYGLSAPEQTHFAQAESQRVAHWCQQIAAHSPAQVILLNFEDAWDGVFGHLGTHTPGAFPYQIRQLNQALATLAQQLPQLALFDLAALTAYMGLGQIRDPSLAATVGLPFTPDFEAALAQGLARMLAARAGRLRKCVVLDLDGLLWGGTIGDDGLAGIQLGGSGPGKAFWDLQRWLQQLQRRGIILCVCSKNEPAAARLPFEQHPDMVLRLEDFALFVANWRPKPENIRHIQQELGIGLDAMVFLDDQPGERAAVRTFLPEVLVPDLPADPARYLPFLSQLNLFETPALSETDAQRTRHYQQATARATLAEAAVDMDAFLQQLQMQATIGPFQPADLPRLAQLSQRTNQFNLRTERHTEAGLQALPATTLTLQLRLSDTFGSYGLIAMLIAEPLDTETLFIRHWCMSCRVFQRGVEALTLNHLASNARAAGFRFLEGEYLPTAKNQPVADLYPRMGFAHSGENRWKLSLTDFSPLPHHIQVVAPGDLRS